MERLKEVSLIPEQVSLLGRVPYHGYFYSTLRVEQDLC